MQYSPFQNLIAGQNAPALGVLDQRHAKPVLPAATSGTGLVVFAQAEDSLGDLWGLFATTLQVS
jgi:hypothetical protein